MELQEKIILEMGRMLSIKSCKAITMDEIAQNIGISKRTLYENFNNKESLIEQCLRFFIDKTVKEANKMVENAENSLDAILKIVHSKSTFIGKFSYSTIMDMKKYYPEVFNAVFTSNSWDKEKHNTKILFNKAVEEGFIMKYVDIRFILNMLELNVYNSKKAYYLEKNNFYPQKVISYLHILIILRGIATIKGVEFIDGFSKMEDLNSFIDDKFWHDHIN